MTTFIVFLASLCSVEGALRLATQTSKHSHMEPSSFLSLFTFFLAPNNTDRQKEYCFALGQNGMNDAVDSIHVFTDLNQSRAGEILAACHATGTQNEITQAVLMQKLSMHTGYKSEQLHYNLLLGEASKRASADALQVVANSDIVLGNWEHVRKFLHLIHSKKLSLHLSWNSEIASNDNRCEHNMLSYDTIAFNDKIPAATLRLLDFQPNILGAENVVVCDMRKAGFTPINPCRTLTTKHIHGVHSPRHYPAPRMNTFSCDWKAPRHNLEDFNGTSQTSHR